jgi:hypothetical protein
MKTYQHGGREIWFESLYLKPNAAIANLGKMPVELFDGDASAPIDAARWRAKMSETQEEFKARIRVDLAREGIAGVIVTVYEHASFWERNISILSPVVRPIIENSVAGE